MRRQPEGAGSGGKVAGSRNINVLVAALDRLGGLLTSLKWAPWYAAGGVLVLLATTLVWAIRGAALQLNNADQLVEPYLFENAGTFHQALFPAQHTFLLKWPIFWLLGAGGANSVALSAITVLVVLLTVGGLTYLLWRIERRAAVFGTLCLALAAVLLLVPAQPSAGTLLPVNMAMLATRNIEYILYIVGLVLLARTAGFKSRAFWLAVLILSAVIATDRLFLALSLGGALLALIAYALAKGWSMVSFAVRWLLASVLAALGAWVILAIPGLIHATHIVNGTATAAGPYAAAQSAHDVALGTLYAALGVLTNFGANPAYDAAIVRHIPHALYARLTGNGLGFVVDAAIFIASLIAAGYLVRRAFVHNRDGSVRLDLASRLAVMLVWSSLAAILAFIFSSHYYAVDARYLTIVLFAGFVCLAVWSRGLAWSPRTVGVAVLVLVVGLISGLLAAGSISSKESAALAPYQKRNQAVAQVLLRHHADVLVGDYWRVLPIKLAAQGRQTVMPLANCTQPREDLSSGTWQPNLKHRSFAYLVSLDKGLTGFPACSLEQIIDKYGRPNASTLIAGSLPHPKELVLFYDHGSHQHWKAVTPVNNQVPATITPAQLSQLPNDVCDVPTVMIVVAHQDDDLLFMNPNLEHEIRAGHCVRTVYVTAGDSGADKFYWLNREQGSQAAYSVISPEDDGLWIQRIVQLSPHAFVTLSTPRSNPKLTLVFMHLPDGNLRGEGFGSTHFESLRKLEANKLPALNAVDGQSSYSLPELTAALTSLMHYFQPTEIWTQANYVSQRYPDHSDHMAVGRLTKTAYSAYESQQYENRLTIPLSFYIGYPVHQFPTNVSGADLAEKQAAYFAYAKFDMAVCQSDFQCNSSSTLGGYLRKQYQNAY